MNIPQHVAIILDGNGRWAKAKGMPRNYGHAQGSKNVEKNPITASDIVYSVKFLQKAGDNVIYKSNVKNVKSCYAKDNLTATITYSQPVGAVVYSLCFPTRC